MNLLIAYDVATDNLDGQRRLRKVAQTCLNFGQRVQKSVFECSVDPLGREELIHALLKVIDVKKDNLRIYHVPEGRSDCVLEFGVATHIDFEGPLVV